MKKVPPPLALLAEITHRCPLRCPYCSNPLELNRRSEEMSTDAWKGVFDEAAKLGVMQVHFSGGEPTVRDDLKDLIGHAEGKGIYTNLITSGVLLDRPMLDGFVDAGLQHVQLSFQDTDVNAADYVSGFVGGHEKKLAVAKMVDEVGLPLTVNAVIHRGNINRVGELIDLAVRLGAQRLEVANVQYYGWGLLNRKALLPTRSQLMAATEIVEVARESLKGRLVIDYVVPDYYARRPKSCMGGWAQRFINVNPVGYVLPCHAAETIPGLEFDRVGVRSLADIWENGQAFTRFRGTDWMSEPCLSCDRKEIDWGGCRCQALAVTGHADVADPACELSPDHAAMLTIANEEGVEGEIPFVYRSIGGARA